LRQQVALLQKALEASRRENALRRQKLDALARRCFGKQSERLDPAQLELLLGGLEESNGTLPEKAEPPARPASSRSRRGSRRIRTPENLEVVCEVIEPDQWKRIGEEVSRQLDFPPGWFFWRETVRPK